MISDYRCSTILVINGALNCNGVISSSTSLGCWIQFQAQKLNIHLYLVLDLHMPSFLLESCMYASYVFCIYSQLVCRRQLTEYIIKASESRNTSAFV
jgi:hypothetical protein